jgi:nucleoside-diphosphate-sugar epimerase
MKRKRILVTGGTGFLGSSLVKRLITCGYEPVILDNNSRGKSGRLKPVLSKLEFIKGDIRNKSTVFKASRGCHALFHLAFINGTRNFYEKPEDVLDVGVKGAINTLEAAIHNNLNSYILASSSEVYNEPSTIPTTERERILIPDIKNPRYSYSGAKIISELLTLNYLKNTSLRHCIFRPHNIFGPDMGFEHVIPEIVKKIIDATDNSRTTSCKITIQGTGSETRSFCFIDEAVSQIMAIFRHGKTGEIYNVGANDERAILSLIRDIGRILRIKVHIKPSILLKGSTRRRCPDIKKVSSLKYKKEKLYQKGLEKTINWYKSYYKR